MANETKIKHSPREQADLLITFYNDILNGDTKPSIEYQKKFLLQLLNTKISMLEKKAGQKKILHFGLRVTAMFLSGLTTVLLGLKINGNGFSSSVSNITLIITAVVTF